MTAFLNATGFMSIHICSSRKKAMKVWSKALGRREGNKEGVKEGVREGRTDDCTESDIAKGAVRDVIHLLVLAVFGCSGTAL